MGKREWKQPIDEIKVASFYALCERLETIVDLLEEIKDKLGTAIATSAAK